MQISELSVFLPTYNEEENIKNVVLNTKTVLERKFSRWEIIVVNDGSKDNTRKVVEDLVLEDPRIRIKSHEANRGYGAALKTGFYNSRYKWIAFIDSDGQFNFSEIDRFVSKQEETQADMIIGYYTKRQVSRFKILTSRLWELSVFILFGLKVHDIDCGFKLMSKSILNKIPHLESERGAFISSELLIKTKNAGFKIVEVPVTHYPRTKGVGTGRNFNVILKSFLDLLRLWKKLKYS